jgi:putative ABC transport system permease protein
MALWQDVRYAARLLVKDRWFTIVAAVALALGIGVNATVFTFVNAVLLRGLPFDHPDRIMWVGTRNAQRQERALSILDFEDWRARATLLDHLVLWQSFAFNVSDPGREPDRFPGVYISWNIFKAIGEQPILGRDFLPEDDKPGAPPVVIIGHSLWQSRYGGDPGVIGKAVTTNAFTPTIIGVMPPDLTFPANNQLWIPLVHMPSGVKPMNRDARQFPALALVKSGVTQEQAEAELSSIAAALADQFPDTNKDFRHAYLMTFSERQNGGEIRLVFLTLLGAVAFVLLIAIGNVANLLLARAAHRSREISVRVSLGASRWRIVRQLLVESIMLAAISGVLGYGLSLIGVRLFDAATQDVGKPSWIHFTMDLSVFGYLAAVTLGTGILFGLAPALHVSKTNVNDVLKEGGRTGAGGMRARRWTSALIVGELALTLVLLAGAGFMMRSFLNLYGADIGIDTTPLLTANLALPDRKYPGPEQRLAFFRQLEERLNAVGPVEAATVASSWPGGGGAARTFVIEARPAPAGTQLPVTTLITTGPRYFDTIGVGVTRGRTLNDTDGLAGQHNVVINERFAALHFAGEDPIGRRVGFTPDAAKPPATWMTIVGVAPNVRQRNADEFQQDPVLYLSYRFEPPLGIGVLVRSRSTAAAVAPLLRAELRAIDPDLSLFQIRTMAENFAQQRWQYTVFGSMFGFFAFIALMLSAVGLYAVTAYSVAQRTQEIGVRMALGAQSSQVLWLFQRRILVQLGIGVVIGLAGAVGVGKLLRGVLVRTEATDLPTLVSIAALLVLVALAAGLWPARRATRLDPVAALRNE